MSAKFSKTTSYVIPAKPEVLINITEELRKPEPDTQYICGQIKQDVALFSSVISTINSAYYGLKHQISSIEVAVSLLGVQRVFSIVRLAALKNSLSTTGPMERFWDTATEVACISAALAKQFTHLDSDEAYTLGMLHDSGIPLMMQAKSDFKDFLRGMNQHSMVDIHEIQIKRYGVSHFQLSAELARKWNFGDSIADAILKQPMYPATFMEPADDNEGMRLNLCLLLLARDISDAYRHFWRLTGTEQNYLNLKPALDFLGISDFDYADLKEDILNTLSQVQ